MKLIRFGYIPIVLFCLNFCNKKVETYKAVDKIYRENNIMIENIIDKDSFNSLMSTISEKYKLNISKQSSLEEIDKEMQQKLIRSRYTQRTDLIDYSSDKIKVEKFFKTDHDIEKYKEVKNEEIFVILGATYKGMDSIISSSLEYLKNEEKKAKNFLILTGDRPFYPEDFEAQNQKKEIIKVLNYKYNGFQKHHGEISKLIEEYEKNKKNDPSLAKAKLYVKLIFLVDKKTATEGLKIIKNLEESKKSQNIFSKNKALLTIKLKEFIYTKALKYLPTETDLAKLLMEKYNLKNWKVIEAKAKFKTQERATTKDTFLKLIDYSKTKNINLNNYILLGLKPFIYRQWLEFVVLIKKENNPSSKSAEYAAIRSKNLNDAIVVDEVGRLVHVILNFQKK